MRNILLTISYDGTDFCGWQRQDSAEKKNVFRTVQGEVENALEKLHKMPVTLYGSGRTDSGVHAVAQKANFFSPIDSIPVEKYVCALNTFLPQDIRITESCEVPEDFNARLSATSRIYRYFLTPKNILANNNRFSWFVNYEPNIERLNNYCKCLSGEIGQNSFPDGKEIVVFEIEANAFLWKMVRTITGTLVNLDKNNAPEDSFQKILEAKDRTKAGATAPAKGLFLYDIKFDGIRRHV